MKKVLKSLSVLLIAACLFFAVAQPVSADKPVVDDVITGVETGTATPVNPAINNVTNTVISWIWYFSIIAAVIVIMVIGLKFIIGSTQEKAEYKKSLIPLVVGALLVVFATTIVKILFSQG